MIFRITVVTIFILIVPVAVSATHVEPRGGGAGQDGWKCFCGPNNGIFGGPGEVWEYSLAPTDRVSASALCHTLCSELEKSRERVVSDLGISLPSNPWNAKHAIFSEFSSVTRFLLSLVDLEAPAFPKYKWTEWYSSDRDTGSGDYELLSVHRRKGWACDIPVDIECRTKEHNLDWREAGQVYLCSPAIGGRCKNREQTNNRCRDYKVRYACPVNQSDTP